MAPNNNDNDYREKAKKEIFDFFLWILRRGIKWVKTLVRWFEKVVGAVTNWFETAFASTVHYFESLTKNTFEELRPILMLVLVAGLGAVVYMWQRMIDLPATEIGVVGAASFILLIVSVSSIIFAAAHPNLDLLGFTKPLKRIRNKIFKAIGVGAASNPSAREEAEGPAKRLAEKSARSGKARGVMSQKRRGAESERDDTSSDDDTDESGK